MDLPLTVVSARSDDLLISVDGAWGQPGLNLSHWPGNTTPRALRHDLSTGIALAFSRLSPDERHIGPCLREAGRHAAAYAPARARDEGGPALARKHAASLA